MIRLRRIGQNVPTEDPEGKNGPNVIPLIGGITYVLGRESDTCEINFLNDNSISRKHGHIRLEHPAGNVDLPYLKPHVLFRDLGSKHGIYTNSGIESEDRIGIQEDEILPIGGRIRFGRNWNQFIIEYTPLIVTYSLELADKKSLIEAIGLLGGHFIPDWNTEHGNITHLVMETLNITIKLGKALMESIPIIRPHYFIDLVEFYRENRKNNAQISDLSPPDTSNYLPPFDQSQIANLAGSEDILRRLEDRSTLFLGKLFLVPNQFLWNDFNEIITKGGGQILFMTEPDLTIGKIGDANTIIIGNSSIIAEEGGDPKIVLDVYIAKGKRTILSLELLYGIIYMDLNVYCNPYQLAPLEDGSRVGATPGPGDGRRLGATPGPGDGRRGGANSGPGDGSRLSATPGSGDGRRGGANSGPGDGSRLSATPGSGDARRGGANSGPSPRNGASSTPKPEPVNAILTNPNSQRSSSSSSTMQFDIPTIRIKTEIFERDEDDDVEVVGIDDNDRALVHMPKRKRV